jgi:pimeloyl-ACP methyl ester carboxylesterase
LRLLVSVAVGAVTLTARPPTAAAESCESVDGPRCFADLPTGIRLAYIETGPVDGATVLFLHGWTDTVRSWSASMSALHEVRPDLHLVAADLRGHGQSSLPVGSACRREPARCFGTNDLAADLFAFLDQRGINRVTIAGHSLGALTAVEMALARPAIVDRVVLVGYGLVEKAAADLGAEFVAGLMEPWRASLESHGVSWPEGAYDLRPLDADPDAASWMLDNWVFDPIASPEFLAEAAVEAAETSLGTYIGRVGAQEAPQLHRLRHLSVPALVLWGIQDPIYLEAEELRVIDDLRVAARGPGSFAWKRYGSIPLPDTFIPTDDISHAVQWAAPQGVALDIEAFIRTGRPTADHYRSGAPDDPLSIVTEPNAAVVISAP